MIHVASGREWRGGQRQTWLLARELAALQVRQSVITRAGSELSRRLIQDGVPVLPVDWQAGISPTALWRLWRHTGGERAILHAHDGHATTVAGMVAQMRSLPFITTRRVSFRLRHPGFWRRADRVVAISNAARESLLQGGVEAGRISLIHSGIDLVRLRQVDPAGAREAAGLPTDRPLILALGQLDPSKDHLALIRAVARLRQRLPQVCCVIGGEGPQRPELERAIRQHNLENHVRLAGFLADPLPLLAAADVFAITSREEGLGTAMLDALALGVPVASTAGGGIPEVLTDGTGLLVEVGDDPALAGALGEILSNPVLRSTLIERGKRRSESFSSVRMAQDYLTLYRSCHDLLLPALPQRS